MFFSSTPKLLLATCLALAGSAMPSYCGQIFPSGDTVVSFRISGTVQGNTGDYRDDLGLFGTAGRDLNGSAVTLDIGYDVTWFQNHLQGSRQYYSPASDGNATAGAYLSATIDGITVDLAPSGFAGLVVVPTKFQFDATNADGRRSQFFLFGSGNITAADWAVPSTVYALIEDALQRNFLNGGAFVSADNGTGTGFNITNGSVSSAPEPGTGATLLLFGALAFAGVKGRKLLIGRAARLAASQG